MNLKIDKLMSAGKGHIFLFVLAIVIVLAALLTFINQICGHLLGDQNVILLLFDGDIKLEEGHFVWQMIISLAGKIFVTGIMLSIMIKFLDERSDRYRLGKVRYKFEHHILFLGAGSLLDETLLGAKNLSGFLVVLTQQPAEQVRAHLMAEISDKEILQRLIVLYGDRSSEEQLQSVHADKADSIYILDDGEKDADAENLHCLESVRQVCKQRDIPAKCHLMSSQLFTLRSGQMQNMSQHQDGILLTISNTIDNWAQRVWVNGEAQGYHYPMLDRGQLRSQSDEYVHVVIAGSTPMAISMASTVAHLAHYPNYVTKGIKTKITFVQPHVDDVLQLMQSHYESLFKFSHWSQAEIKKNKIEIVEKYAPQADNDFLDIEWNFIDSSIDNRVLRQWLCDCANDKKQLLTIVMANADDAQNMSQAIDLPFEVLASDACVLVYQSDHTSRMRWAQVTDRYKNLYPFGMQDNCYDASFQERLRWAIESNNVYEEYAMSIDPNHKKTEWKDLRIADQYSNLYHANYAIATLSHQPESKYFAQLEHNRWMMEKLLVGFTAIEDKTERIRLDNCPDEKRALKKLFVHPNIASFDELQKETQDIDEILVCNLLRKFANK